MDRRAYAILDGGGVKGAALAGCLKAAEEIGLQFAGYGGTSAGSIVALLATVGYTGDELRQTTVDEIEFTNFLDDGGISLGQLKTFAADISGIWENSGGRWARGKAAVATAKKAFSNRDLLKRLLHDLGLYHAHYLREFLRRKIVQKLPELRDKEDITFNDLANCNRPPLRIVSADLRRRAPRTYSAERSADMSVIGAVRASMSYPFVFRPVQMSDSWQVDGGLSSNLPLSVFEKERRHDQLPVVAFDLVATNPASPPAYTFGHFCGDMLSTALESGEHLVLDMMAGVHHVPVKIPEGVSTLDFEISREARAGLFTAGHSATHTYFSKNLPQWRLADDIVQWVQAQYAAKTLVLPILRAVVRDFEDNTTARGLRAAVMLPTGRGTRIVAYHYNFDGDPDSDLELAQDAGCTGTAWSRGEVTLADLSEARDVLQTRWKMTEAQQNRVKSDRKAMIALPIFDRPLSNSLNTKRRVVGTLSIDTSSTLRETQWSDEKRDFAVRCGQQWSEVLSKLLIKSL